MIPLGLDGQIGGSDCEVIGNGLLAQPVNALTSAVYIATGLAVWWRMPAEQRWRAGGLYSLLLVLVGVGSVLYHGPQLPGSQQAHDLPIAGLFVVMGVVLLVRWRRGQALLPGASGGRFIALAVVGAVGLLAYATGRTGSVLCDPESLLQPHGLWHICGAIAFGIVGDMLFQLRLRRPARSRSPESAQASP